MMRCLHLPDLRYKTAHAVDRVDALVRVGGMSRHAERLDDDLAPAALSDLEVQVRGFADHNVVRLHGAADVTRRDTLKALLVDNARDIYIPGKVPAGILRKRRSGYGHGGVRALHVRCAAAVDFAILDFRGKRIMVPHGRVRNGHRIDVAVEQKLFSGPLPVNHTDDVAVFVRRHLIESVPRIKVLQDGDNSLLMPGIALPADKFPAQFNDSFFSFLG